MPVALDRIVRMSPGEAMQFAWTLKPELLEAATRWAPDLPQWLHELEGAEVNADHVAAERCVVKLCSPQVCAQAELLPASDGTYTFILQATRRSTEAGELRWSWQREKLTAMLGGKHDAYLAVMATSGRVPVLRLRYQNSTVELFVLSAAFAHRLPAALRALAPGELKVGELLAPGQPRVRADQRSPCGCH